MTKFKRGIAGKRSGKCGGVLIHNDAGSKNANAKFYKDWLPKQNAANGFAHAYIAQDGLFQAEDKSNRAWHCGNATMNNSMYSIEVCQSKGDKAQFLKNEQAAFKHAASILKWAGLQPNRNTVRLHREVFATSCPHRSYELHGKNVNKVKDYYIAQIKKYMGTTTVAKPKKKKAYLKAGHVVNVRHSPSVKGKLYLTKRKKGQSVNPTGKYINADGYRWMEYLNIYGKKVYAAMNSLKTPKNTFWTIK